jgi:hypothetical protein
MCARKIEFSERQLREIEDRYKSGEALEEIAAAMGCSRDVIRARLVQRNVSLRKARKDKKCIFCGVALDGSNTTAYRQKNYIYKCNDCIKTEKAIDAREARRRDPGLQAERSHRHQERLRKTSPKTYSARQMRDSAKKRAASLGLPYDLDSEFIESICPDKCPVLDIKLKYGGGNKAKDSPSLDRVIPNLGYTKANVVVISMLANLMKSEASPEELIKFAEWVDKTYCKGT